MTEVDTIFALSSGRGRAGIAVIRVSGPGAGTAIRQLTGRDVPPPRRAAYRTISGQGDGNGDGGTDGDVIDRGLVLWFPGPASVTGEDVAEFHVHGGRAVIDGVLDRLGTHDGLRPAEAGEFSRRAFENGKMDLTGVEGLADLINAETAAQRRQAVRQMDGRLGALYEDWRGRLVNALAYLEAEIDFPDEDLPEGMTEHIRGDVTGLVADIAAHLADDRRGERLREGFQAVILGAPNVGKSTLLNALARREAAIVSETAGTTRDVIEVHLDLAGLPVTVVDTAGLRDSTEAIEAEGVRRAEARAQEADLCVVVCEARDWPSLPAETRRWLGPDDVLVVNKADLVATMAVGPLDPPAELPAATVAVSAGSGDGLDRLLALVTERAESALAPMEAPVLTRTRHRRALEDCIASLKRYLEGAGGGDPVLAAEDLRLAARALGRITGRVDVEDILDVVFRDFCIGK